MELVERHVIKPSHRFYDEIDRLSLLAKNLYNSDQTKFKAEPKIPKYKGTPGNLSDGRYVIEYNYQAVSRRALKKGLGK